MPGHRTSCEKWMARTGTALSLSLPAGNFWAVSPPVLVTAGFANLVEPESVEAGLGSVRGCDKLVSYSETNERVFNVKVVDATGAVGERFTADPSQDTADRFGNEELTPPRHKTFNCASDTLVVFVIPYASCPRRHSPGALP